jgi:hypothetical protein
MSDFQYSYRAYDLPDSKQESEDLIDARDKQLEYYIKNNINGELASINQTNTNQSNLINNIIDTYVPQLHVRAGTSVITLPAVGGFVTINYATADTSTQSAFSSLISWREFSIVVTNGDYPANPARFAIQRSGLTGFRCYHEGGGNVGGLARVNFYAMAFV